MPSAYSPRPGHDWNPLRRHRNIPCPCGSGHKAKRCHGRAEILPEEDVRKIKAYLVGIHEKATFQQAGPADSGNQQRKENTMGKDLHKRVDSDFTYHRPPAEKVQDFVQIREKAKELAHLVVDLVPRGREQATALTRIEEAVMHANAGIARQYPAEVPPVST